MPALLDQFGRPYGYGPGGTPGAIYAASYADPRTTPSHPDCFGDFTRLLPRVPWRKAVSDCRWIAAAFTLVGGAAEQKADYVSASNFATYFEGDDTAWGDEAEALLERYDALCTTRSPLFNWASFWRCGVLNLIDSGPFFIHLAKDDNGLPLLQPLEAHRIGCWDTTEDLVKGGRFDGAKILNGIIYDRAGNEIGYRVLGYETGAYQDIPAAQMVHAAGHPRYFSQGRALPQISTALKDLYTILDTREAEQIAQNANSRLTFVENNETGKRPTVQDLVNPRAPTENGTPTEMIDKGYWRYVKNGGNLRAHESNRPSDQWDRFDTKITATALYGMRWRVEMLDLAKLNGGAVRGFADNINTSFLSDFRGLVPAVKRCRGHQVACHIERGDLRDHPEFLEWAAQEPPEFTADPGRQINSEIEAVRAGAQSMPDVHRRWGKRPRKVLRDQARYLRDKKEIAKEFGCLPTELGTTSMPGDPENVAQPGAAPGSAPTDTTAQPGQTTPNETAAVEAEATRNQIESLGVAVRAGAITPSPEIEAATRTLLKLPAMSEAVTTAWKENKIRLPITLAGGAAAEAEPTAAQPGTPPTEQ